MLVDEDAAIDIDVGIVEKSCLRVNTDPDCDNIATHNVTAACHDGFNLRCAEKLFDVFSENQLYASFSKIFSEELRDLGRAFSFS